MRPIDADALKKKLGMYYGITCYCADGVVDSIENEIDSAPTIGRWIPVTERLPEEEGWYLVTRMWANEKTPKIVTEWWFADTKNWATMGKVLAWMELPKPYEGSE